MFIPIVMAFLSLILPYSVNRRANIIVAMLVFFLNLVGLPLHSSITDKFLITLRLGFDVVTVLCA